MAALWIASSNGGCGYYGGKLRCETIILMGIAYRLGVFACAVLGESGIRKTAPPNEITRTCFMNVPLNEFGYPQRRLSPPMATYMYLPFNQRILPP